MLYTSGNETNLRRKWLATDGRTELEQCDAMRQIQDGKVEWDGYVDVEEWRGLGTGQSKIHRSYYTIGPDGIGFETSETGKRMIGLSEAGMAKASVGSAFSVIPIRLPEPRRYYTGETLPDTCDYWRNVYCDDQGNEKTGRAFESSGGPAIHYVCVARLNEEQCQETVAIVSVGCGLVVEVPAHVDEEVDTDPEVVETTTGFWRKERYSG